MFLKCDEEQPTMMSRDPYETECFSYVTSATLSPTSTSSATQKATPQPETSESPSRSSQLSPMPGKKGYNLHLIDLNPETVETLI